MALPTDAIASSSSLETPDWQTPVATPYGSSQNGINGKGGENERPSAGTPSLEGLARLWATPIATRGSHGPNPTGGEKIENQARLWQTPATDSFRSRGGDRKDEPGLDQQARLWATPTAADHDRGAGGDEKREGAPNLNTQASLWSTPCARDWKAPNGPENNCGLSQLNNQVQDWPTPRAADGEKNIRTAEGSLREIARKGAAQDLAMAAAIWPPPATSDSRSSGRVTTTTGVMHPGVSLTDARDWAGAAPPPGPTSTDAGDSGRPDPRMPRDGVPSSSNTPASSRQSSDPGEWATLMAGTNRKSTRAIEASRDNGRRTGGGQSSPPGLEQMAELAMGEMPPEIARAENLPPETQRLVDAAGAANPRGAKGNPAWRRDEPPKRVLNPTFVCALMGWPNGWCFASIRSDSVETESSPSKPPSRSRSSRRATRKSKES